MPNRKSWLLLFLSKAASEGDGPAQLDPVRIEKGMFLLTMRGPTAARDLYRFQPYNWGPYSAQVNHDLEELRAAGLVEAERAQGQTWRKYRVTSGGEFLAREFSDRLAPEDVAWIRSLRHWLAARSFNQLLRDVYDAYPEYATNSLFVR